MPLLHICEQWRVKIHLDLVNINAYTKFCHILSICSQYIERKLIEFDDDRITEGQGESSIAPHFQSGSIIMIKVLLACMLF